jgi:hypothetical protein
MTKTNSLNAVSTVTSLVHVQLTDEHPCHVLVVLLDVAATGKDNREAAWEFWEHWGLPSAYLIPPDKRTWEQVRSLVRFCEHLENEALSWLDQFDNVHGKLATEEGCIIFPSRVYEADVDSSDEDMAEAEAAGAEAAEDM